MSYFIYKNYIFRDCTGWETADDDFLQLFLLQTRNKRTKILIAHEKDVCTKCQAFADYAKFRTQIVFDFKVLRPLRGDTAQVIHNGQSYGGMNNYGGGNQMFSGGTLNFMSSPNRTL